jgi:hypothetical protein
LRFLKGKRQSLPPGNPEELRRKYKIMGAHWCMIHLRHPNKGYLENMAMAPWDHFVEWLLGADVAELKGYNEKGQLISWCTWTMLLNFELECRKRMIKKVNEDGETILDALASCKQDMELRQFHLLTPMSFMPKNVVIPQGGIKRELDLTPTDPTNPWGGWAQSELEELKAKKKAAKDRQRANKAAAKNKGNPKGGGKGDKGKGKGKQTAWGATPTAGKKLHSKTPDGKNICFSFGKGKCAIADRKFAHVCQICLGAHAKKDCPDK